MLACLKKMDLKNTSIRTFEEVVEKPLALSSSALPVGRIAQGSLFVNVDGALVRLDRESAIGALFLWLFVCNARKDLEQMSHLPRSAIMCNALFPAEMLALIDEDKWGSDFRLMYNKRVFCPASSNAAATLSKQLAEKQKTAAEDKHKADILETYGDDVTRKTRKRAEREEAQMQRESQKAKSGGGSSKKKKRGSSKEQSNPGEAAYAYLSDRKFRDHVSSESARAYELASTYGSLQSLLKSPVSAEACKVLLQCSGNHASANDAMNKVMCKQTIDLPTRFALLTRYYGLGADPTKTAPAAASSSSSSSAAPCAAAGVPWAKSKPAAAPTSTEKEESVCEPPVTKPKKAKRKVVVVEASDDEDESSDVEEMIKPKKAKKKAKTKHVRKIVESEAEEDEDEQDDA